MRRASASRSSCITCFADTPAAAVLLQRGGVSGCSVVFSSKAGVGPTSGRTRRLAHLRAVVRGLAVRRPEESTLYLGWPKLRDLAPKPHHRRQPVALLRPHQPPPRVRSHCRFSNRRTEYFSESGMKWMSGSAKRHCDRALPPPPPPPPAGPSNSSATARRAMARGSTSSFRRASRRPGRTEARIRR